MLVKMAIREMLKIDLDKNKQPDVIQALDGLDAALDGAGSFLAKLDEGDWSKLLTTANNHMGGKFTRDEIALGAKQLATLPPALAALDLVIEGIAGELKKKK